MQRRSRPIRDKLSALALAKECYSIKLDMLTNASAINQAIDFVRKKKQWREAEQKANDSEAKVEAEAELTDCQRLEQEQAEAELTDCQRLEQEQEQDKEEESNTEDNPEAQF